MCKASCTVSKLQYSGYVSENINISFSLHSVSVIFVTYTHSLSLSNCDSVLAANSVNLKNLIYECDGLCISTVPDRGAVGCVSWCWEQVTLSLG
jgi:hypothetical protein